MKNKRTIAAIFSIILVSTCQQLDAKAHNNGSSKVSVVDRHPDSSFTKAVKKHWHLTRSGTPMKISVDFRLHNGIFQCISMQDLARENHEVDELVELSVVKALEAGCHDYSAPSTQNAGEYNALFVFGPKRNSTIKIESIKRGT
ncbi:MAG: hypothetical protein EKK48_10590 [Candidatus Melainabacteria bacterium]|nr:MAG: hypothetical protein EKK48_10590 [Candidatus Melainabacteria bacterium]